MKMKVNVKKTTAAQVAMQFVIVVIVGYSLLSLASYRKIANASSFLSPGLGVPRISDVKDDGTVDVAVEVESISEDVTADANDRSKKKKLTSGVYDLRLFRDGQLVGTSAAKEKLEEYIDKAPVEVAKDQEAYKKNPKDPSVLLNTNEDKLWRAANVIISNTEAKVQPAGGVCAINKDVPTKATCTFKNIKLPRDGRKEIEFTAYAFNADRVKSDTTKFTYQIPESFIAKGKRVGKAYLISIGVNASENAKYNLQYAANDARKMQEIVGGRLKAEGGKYSEVISLPLISDHGKEQSTADAPVENLARKAIIKAVFSLLAGNEKEVPADILKQIPNREMIKPVEPEDTLIITYSGHGYADQAGIFYLLPYDIGKDTTKFTPESLRRMISSDELSLWMREITSTEMVMVIDACHSSAAVQGDGFKPGPMGSRGFGQLSYDKGMKILSATQADNVALELGSLQQGLLSFALLEDGIKCKLADGKPGDGKLTTTEWLAYAESRVPQLYQEAKDGTIKTCKSVAVSGEVKTKGDVVDPNTGQRASVDLQKPRVFDFKKRNQTAPILSLP